MIKPILPLLLSLCFTFGPVFIGRAAEDGVSDSEIKVGMANAQTGNSAALGTGMKKGATVFFDQLNASGGVCGRKVNLIAYDDGYEPEQTVVQTEKLISFDKVFALFGYVGTPTSTAILPSITKASVPYFGPFTGAEFLRNPVKKQIFNVRASYFDETEGLVDRLVTDLGIKSIGVFIQDDAYGTAGEAGVMKALRKRDLVLAGKGTYKRNTVEVEGGVANLKLAAPKAVIMVGTYKACAAFIKQCKADGFTPVFCNISFVGTAPLIRELGADGDGVFISQVMPSPLETFVPLVGQYRDAMKAAGETDYDYTSLEGYVAASLFTEGLKKTGRNLTRISFTAALESLSTDLGGLPMSFSPLNHQALKTVYFTKIQGGKALPVAKF